MRLSDLVEAAEGLPFCTTPRPAVPAADQRRR
jgi:hypothetical protein